MQISDLIPVFWQGVLASVLAAIICGIAVSAWKITAARTKQTANARQAERERLKRDLLPGSLEDWNENNDRQAAATRYVLIQAAINFVTASVVSSVAAVVSFLPILGDLGIVFGPVSLIAGLVLYYRCLSWLRFFQEASGTGYRP